MNKSYQYLDIDVNKKIHRRLRAVQGDAKSRYILVSLYNNSMPFDLSNCSVKIFGVKSDKKIFFNYANIIDTSKGQFEIELTSQALAVNGELQIQILVLGANQERLTTCTFFIDVDRTIVDDNAIQSENEFTALTKGLADLAEYDTYKNNVLKHDENLIKHENKLNEVSSQLAHITNYPFIIEGDDSDKINLTFEKFKVVKLDRDYNIFKTIEIPNNCVLDLNGYTLTIKNYIDGIALNSNSSIKNGVVKICNDIQNDYNCNAIVINCNSLNTTVDCSIINETLETSNNFCCTGNAIKFDLSKKNSFIAYANIKGYIKGFDVGVDVTVPNLTDHVVGSGYDNWATQCNIHCFINGSNLSINLNDMSNHGRSIHGFDINVRGQAGWYREQKGYNEAIFAKCELSNFNVILDDAGRENSRVEHFITFDKYSKQNTFSGVATRVNDLGNNNIIINNSNFICKKSFASYNGIGATPQGIQNDVFYCADKRFTVSLENDNTSFYQANNIFYYGVLNSEAGLNIKNTAIKSIGKYVINFGKIATLNSILIGLGSRDFRESDIISIRYFKDGIKLGEENKKMSSNNIFFLSDLNIDNNQIDMLEVVFIIDKEPNFSSLTINGLKAFGSISSEECGGLVSRSGGNVFGDLKFYGDKGITLNSPKGDTYKIQVDDSGNLIAAKIN